MEIKVGFEITYAAQQATPMVIMLSIHPSRYSDIVGTETIIAEPDTPIGFYRDSFGNVCGRLVAPVGGLSRVYSRRATAGRVLCWPKTASQVLRTCSSAGT